MIVACVLRRRRLLSGLVLEAGLRVMAADQFQAQGDRTDLGQIGSPSSSHEDLYHPAARAALPDDVERSAALQLSSPPGSKMCALMISLHRRTHAEQLSIRQFAAVRHRGPLRLLLPADLAAIEG